MSLLLQGISDDEIRLSIDSGIICNWAVKSAPVIIVAVDEIENKKESMRSNILRRR